MSNYCIRLLEVVLLLTGISLSSEFPRIQIQRGEEVNLAYSCIHMLDDKQKDLPSVFMLHGLTDNRNTWNGIYQVIAMRTGRRVCTIDARNHGDSDWSDDFSVDIMTDDVLNLMRKMKVEKVAVIGHSMGGQITMNMAIRQPEKVEMIIIEDAAPVFSKEKGAIILQVLKIIKQSISTVPINSTESEAQDIVMTYLMKTLGDALPENLSRIKRYYLAIREVNGVWQWKTNFDAIIKFLENTGSFGNKAKMNVYSGKALFIYGTASVFKVFEDKDTILKFFPKAEFVGIEGAPHSIHPSYPQFLTEVLKFLKSSSDFQ